MGICTAEKRNGSAGNKTDTETSQFNTSVKLINLWEFVGGMSHHKSHVLE